MGATVTATNVETGERLGVATDNYGDFWLKNLADGAYTILVEKPGYRPQKLGPIDITVGDRSLGDIALWKA